MLRTPVPLTLGVRLLAYFSADKAAISQKESLMKRTALNFCTTILLATLAASCSTYNPRDDYKFIYTTAEGCGITQRDEAYIKKHEITSINWTGTCSQYALAEDDGTYTENSKTGQFVQYKGRMYHGYFSYGILKYATGWTFSGDFTNGGFTAGKIYKNDRLVFRSKGCEGWCSSTTSSLYSGTHFLENGYTIDGDFSSNSLIDGKKINYETGVNIINAQAKDPSGKFHVGWVEGRRFNTLAAYDEASKDFNRRKEAAAEAARQKAEAEDLARQNAYAAQQAEKRRRDSEEFSQALRTVGEAANAYAAASQQRQALPPATPPASQYSQSPAAPNPSTSNGALGKSSASQPAVQCISVTRPPGRNWALMRNNCSYYVTVDWCYAGAGGDCKNGDWGGGNLGNIAPNSNREASTFSSGVGKNGLYFVACSGRDSTIKVTGPKTFLCP